VFDSKLLIPEDKNALINMNAIRFTLKKSNGTIIDLKTTNKGKRSLASNATNITTIDEIKPLWNITSF
jgi:hypothetical protein